MSVKTFFKNVYKEDRDKYPKTISPLFVVISVLFVALLMLSNIIAAKLVNIFGITLTAAVLIFPLTYIFGDILTEVYGFYRSRLIIWLGFGANIVMVLVFWMAIALPYPVFYEGQTAFASVLGSVPRIVAASLVAYLFGEFLNSIVLSRLKVKTGGKYLWVRTITSTIVGEGLDSLLFIVIAFVGTMPVGALFMMVLAQYVFKVVYEIIITPVTYLVVGRVKKAENLDTFDTNVKYNPFGIHKEK